MSGNSICGRKPAPASLAAPAQNLGRGRYVYTPCSCIHLLTLTECYKMCKKPLIFNGYETACRECNECAATYKNSWVARCVAEKQTLPHAYSITLTYADVDGRAPLGARVYRYKDVSDMWKRIRSAGRRKWGKEFELRYVIVGEKGTKFGRCHYHGVIFSNYPIHELGSMTHSKGEGLVYKQRLNWSLWGNGFVEFQTADRKGMAYALKYILKARMTAARSEGMAREGKTEYLASSYLWCSKVPAIGQTWLWSKLHDLVGMATCPASLRVRVPGGGDWYIRGKLQEEMCFFLHYANNHFWQEHGRDLAGFAPLVASVADEIELQNTGQLVKRKPWLWLTEGPEKEEFIDDGEEKERRDDDSAEFERRIAANVAVGEYAAKARRCFGILPCAGCSADRTIEQIANDEQVIALWRHAYKAERTRYARQGYRLAPFDLWITRQGLVADGCKELCYRSDEIYAESREHEKRCAEAFRLQRQT